MIAYYKIKDNKLKTNNKMTKKLINEAERMQKLAGLIKEDYNLDTEEDDEIEDDAPDSNLDVEDLEKGITATQLGGEDRGIKSMRSAAEQLAFLKGQKDILFTQYKKGSLPKDSYINQVMPIQTKIKQLDKTINKPLMGTDDSEEM